MRRSRASSRGSTLPRSTVRERQRLVASCVRRTSSIEARRPERCRRDTDLARRFRDKSVLDGLLEVREITTLEGWSEPCLEGVADIAPEVAGLQPTCAVSDVVRHYDNAVVYERTLPQCNGSNRPCWRVQEDRLNCAFGFGDDVGSHDGYTLRFDRVDFPPRGTIIVGNCVAR